MGERQPSTPGPIDKEEGKEDEGAREGRLKLQSLERSGSSTLQLVRIAKEDRELKEELGETRQQTALRLAHCSEREERLKARREDLRIRKAANEDFLKVVDSKVGKAEKKRQVEERECRGLDGEIIELKKREAELIEMKRMVEEEVDDGCHLG
ncbi:conserved hypothetical protein [Perkinsus marinus ATCC 50983]|uniref:Uncharacterized protein n=1 Tax=Perkinsus marinus (strain ATCC 50983 / TXsc) TaxID=423536 RepID=C5LWM4_PERM5|nr:conserved hypothetical protein [Perkinsus marinus ATCC 50983]EEQ98868.1 conserved hypothetical protein [Perkinsus marinus ATCC 50983]|eukprot:XP_002766151.1 conserved hypothetical protein [Perkinsus marinus ATCC 50983]